MQSPRGLGVASFLALFLAALVVPALSAPHQASGPATFRIVAADQPQAEATAGHGALPAPRAVPRPGPPVVPAAGTSLLSEAFSGTSTAPNAWLATGSACLTAGDQHAPSSIPACTTGTHDPVGQGVLQLTSATNVKGGMVVSTVPVSTAGGLQITFTDYVFNATTPAADGMTVFLSIGSAPVPTTMGQLGGSLGYASGTVASGIANAYVGIGFDEFGGFSNPVEGRHGGPGSVPETIAVRGAASAGYPYLGGATGANGQPASLPFPLDQPGAKRPANAPTIRATLTPAGNLTVAIDRHDGAGFVTYFAQAIAGAAGQPPVPPKVYVGLTAATGGLNAQHQIGGLAVTSLTPAGSFTPKQIPGLAAWYDANDAATITKSGAAVSAWHDKSGHLGALEQSVAAAQPSYVAAGIAGLGSIAFNGAAYLVGTDPAFSSNLFNESTVFFVTNQTSAKDSSVLWSGPYLSDPRWNVRLTEGGVSNFDFNNHANGRLSGHDVATGPATWSAAGSVGTHAQILSKNGNVVASGAGPSAAVSGSYPLVAGATAGSGHVAYRYTGQIGEILVYKRYLASGELELVQGYLACKWGLQNRLPANHPYATTCPQGAPLASPVPTASPLPHALVAPPVLRSTNGSLVFDVTAKQSASGTPQFVYNGGTTPPTLRLQPGDTLIVNLTNSLPVPSPNAGYANATSLHYHGLHVSPNAPSDDSITMLAQPGQVLHYQVHLPANHPTGLYWYHSHAHGEAERQNLAGMSGALIVDGIAQTVPQVATMPERVLLVRDATPGGTLPSGNALQLAAMLGSDHAMQMGPLGAPAPRNVPQPRAPRAVRPFVLIDPNFRLFRRSAVSDTHCNGTETAAKVWTVNGQKLPSIGIRPGEKQFWRLANAGSDTYLDVQVDNTQMQIVALDGVPLGNGGAPPIMTVSHYVVPPASRVEFIVAGPPSGPPASLRTNCFDAGPAGPAMPAAKLAPIDPAHSPADDVHFAQRVAHRVAHRVAPAANVTAAFNVQKLLLPTLVRQQTVYFSDQNTINGVAYDPAGPPLFYAQLGTVEEWTVVNNSTQVHTFHIHQIHFIVEQINGVTQSPQLVMDNVNVPASTANGPGTVKLRMDFTDPLILGTFLVHCHILAHEDGGMMAQIRVGTAPPLVVNPASATFASATAPAQKVTISGGKAPYSVTGCTSVAHVSLAGTTITITPAAAGTCVITVADASGLTAPITVTVKAPHAAITLSPASIGFAGTTAAAQHVAIQGGTAPFTASGCSGTASAAVGATTLTVTPQAIGFCAITVTDAGSNHASLAVSVNDPTAPNARDNVTFHQNPQRHGWYAAEKTLTVANVSPSTFGALASLHAPPGMPAFSKVYAQPLYVTAETAGGGPHNLVVIASSTAQLYAFDDATNAVVWHRDFTDPTHGIRQQVWGDTGCSDVTPDLGIISTPVIDRALDRLYVVVATAENGTYHLRLHAVSLASGLDVAGAGPTEVSGSVTVSGLTFSINPLHNFSRSALLEANGSIYVALASHCDQKTSTTSGWVVAYDAKTLAQTANILNTTNTNDGSTYFLGSPWMAGFGPASDPQGSVYFATGNGPWNGTTNFAMSVMKVPGNLDLSKTNSFTPASWQQDSGADADLGSGGLMVLPDQTTGSYPRLVIQGGKCGQSGCQKYVLNRDAMGGMKPNDTGAVWHANTGGGMWGGPAYFKDASGNQYVVYGGGQPLSTYTLGLAPVALTVQSSANVGCLECRDQGSQPVVSSNGTAAGTAVVWALKTPGNGGGAITLYAFDALSMSHTLVTLNAGTWNQTPGTSWIGGALVSPLVANGKVYVPTDGVVAVFGLK